MCQFWMQDAGYNTYYIGKMWNAHTVDNYNNPYPGGFNQSDFLLDPHTYEYYNASMTRNGQPPRSFEGQYSPDIVANVTYEFLDEAVKHDRPFFLVSAPVAPHGNAHFDFSSLKLSLTAPKYASRHAQLFTDYKIPRTDNFNPDKVCH